MDSYFSPVCIRPLFLMDDIKDASHCGLLTGVIYSFFFSALLIGIFIYLYHKKELLFVYIPIACLILLWIIVPNIFKEGYKHRWTGYNEAKTQFKNE